MEPETSTASTSSRSTGVSSATAGTAAAAATVVRMAARRRVVIIRRFEPACARWVSSVDGLAAIDNMDGSGDEARKIGRQVQDRTRNLPHMRDALLGAAAVEKSVAGLDAA